MVLEVVEMIFGIIDIGSHTLRLAVYERKNGVDSLLTKTKFALGLAGYLKDGTMSEEGIFSLLTHLKDFCKFLRAFDITEVHSFATAALRMSKNNAEILARIKAETGLDVKIISGEEEAALAFIGATKDSPIKEGALIDIGGGSTEIVTFVGDKIIENHSLPIGAVSLSKKYNAEFFPSKKARESVRLETLKTAQTANIKVNAKKALVLGGAAKGAKLLLNRDIIDSISKEEIDELLNRFQGELSSHDKSLLLREVADRAPILITGFVMLSTLMETMHTEKFYYKDGGVREGYIDKYIK
ncbi:MAG: exopolyphosphatase [Selenomonadaceae bacterium]|nr:exopolyphosphatase [Selenomonadaceae bacterium]